MSVTMNMQILAQILRSHCAHTFSFFTGLFLDLETVSTRELYLRKVPASFLQKQSPTGMIKFLDSKLESLHGEN